ncbi:MAG: hypothetical protein ACOC2W_01410 [bacterium]
MIYGVEIQDIIKNIFDDVKNYRKSEQIKVCCPRCQERDNLLEPDGKFNLEINTKRNVFHCWKCDNPEFKGNIGKLIYLYGSHHDYKIYKSYSQIYYNKANLFQYENNNEEEDFEVVSNIQLPEGFLSFKDDFDSENRKHLLAYDYCISDRKLTKDQLIRYNVGFCFTGKYQYRIIIPSYDNLGNLNYFTSRYFGTDKREPKYKNPEIDKEKIIFNEYYINWDSTIFLVEGVFDMFALPMNSLILMGKEMYSLIFNKIKEKKPNIVIVLDPDAISKSVNIYRELLSIYGYINNKIKIINLDKDMDIDEVKRFKGKEQVKKMLRQSKNLSLDDLDFYK